MTPQTTGQKILHFPLTKIIIGIVAVVGMMTAGQVAFTKLFELAGARKEINDLVTGIGVALIAILTYILLYTFYERRRVTEFYPTGMVKHLALGIGLGALLQSLTILVIYLAGGYTVEAINPISFLLPPLTMAFTSAIFEEILLRGIVFRIVEDKLGSYIALGVSALLFGLLHLGNPNSSWLAAIGLALQAGVLLAAAYMYARNLWFPIAIHFAWNFTQSAVFGASVSGNAIKKTLITSKIEGAEWYTGGAFGPEGSIQATLFCVIAAGVLLVLSKRRGHVVRPYWKKGK